MNTDRKHVQFRIAKRKSEIQSCRRAQIVRIVRKAGLDYDGWRYVAKKVRQACELTTGQEGTAVAAGAHGR